MIKKNPILFGIIIVLFMVIVFEVFYIYKGDSTKVTTDNNFDYRLLYYDDDYSDTLYDITIKENKVIVEESNTCNPDRESCIPSRTEKKISRYSDENIKKLKDFIINNFEVDTNTISIYKKQLTNEQIKVMSGLLLGEYYFELDVEPYKYLLVYQESTNLEYEFFFKDDKTILTKVVTIDDNYDITNIDSYYVDFEEENIDMLFDYISKEELNNYSTVNKSVIYKNEKSILISLIRNDESYLEDYENDTKLAYIISYDGINCDTPVLRLYDDNTYELFDTYTDGGPLIPVIGSYDYDIEKIIGGITKYPPTASGPYVITDADNNKFITYDSNEELNEFLKSINVNLGRCSSLAK